jgi:phosphoribosylformylglycinamidine cyclo-ligase
MAVIVHPTQVAAVSDGLTAAGETVHRIGTVEAGNRGCTVSGSIETWSAREPWEATYLHD